MKVGDILVSCPLCLKPIKMLLRLFFDIFHIFGLGTGKADKSQAVIDELLHVISVPRVAPNTRI